MIKINKKRVIMSVIISGCRETPVLLQAKLGF